MLRIKRKIRLLNTPLGGGGDSSVSPKLVKSLVFASAITNLNCGEGIASLHKKLFPCGLVFFASNSCFLTAEMLQDARCGEQKTL